MIKVGILGSGSMGQLHTNSLKKIGVPIVAVCDSNQESLKTYKASTEIKDINTYSDFDSFLGNGDFDVMFDCLPPFAQNDQFEKAVMAGKHVFIEKPIALNTVIGARMVQAAKKSGVITQVGFHMRRAAAIKRLAELVQSGAAGKAVLFNAQYQCNSLHTPWWKNVDLSGGQIFEQAIHIYDLCRYLFGDPKFVEGIMANVCHNHIREYTVEDVSACIAGFSTGAIASITANNCSIPNRWIGKITATFEKLTADFADENHGTITFTSEKEIRTENISSDEDPHFYETVDFIKCCEKGLDTDCDIIEGYKSLCFVETVVSSAKLDGAKLSFNTQY